MEGGTLPLILLCCTAKLRCPGEEIADSTSTAVYHGAIMPPPPPPPIISHLQPDGGDEPLDLGRLEALLGVLLALLGGEGPLQHVLAHVVLLAEVEELADLVGPLGSEPARDGDVRQAGNLLQVRRAGRGQRTAADTRAQGTIPPDRAERHRKQHSLELRLRAVATPSL